MLLSIVDHKYRQALDHLVACLKPAVSQSDSMPLDWAPFDAEIPNLHASWVAPFYGDGSQHLAKKLEEIKQSPANEFYFKGCFILGGSGVGKSKLARELANTRTYVPLVIRQKSDAGYLPADTYISDFMVTMADRSSEYDCAKRAYALLAGILDGCK